MPYPNRYQIFKQHKTFFYSVSVQYESVQLFFHIHTNMNVNFVMWTVSIIVIKSHNADETCSKSRSISHARYQIFVPMNTIYSVMYREDCRALNGTYTASSDTPIQIRNLMVRILKKSNVGFASFCKFPGTILWNQNVIKFMNEKICRYDTGYCYVNNHFLVWDISSKLDGIILLKEILYLRETKILQTPEKFLYFTNQKLNLTLKVENELYIDNKKYFSISQQDILVALIDRTAQMNNYFELSNYEKNLANLTNKPSNKITLFPGITTDSRNNRSSCSQVISFGQYQIFVPIKTVYSVLSDDNCKKLNGTTIPTPKKIQHYKADAFTFTMQNVQFVCEFVSKVVWLHNVLELMDRQLCQYDTDYCVIDKYFLFWDITSKFDKLIVLEGNLYLRQTEILQPPEKLLYFQHEKYNLTLKIEQELTINNETYFSIVNRDVLVKFMRKSIGKYGFVDKEISEKYLGKLSEQEFLYPPEKDGIVNKDNNSRPFNHSTVHDKNETVEKTGRKLHPNVDIKKNSTSMTIIKNKNYNKNILEIIFYTVTSFCIIIECVGFINIWIRRDVLFC